MADDPCTIVLTSAVAEGYRVVASREINPSRIFYTQVAVASFLVSAKLVVRVYGASSIFAIDSCQHMNGRAWIVDYLAQTYQSV